MCSAHLRWELTNVTPDEYYHRMVVLGQVEPTWDWMTAPEAEAVLNGRYRGDGRRLDQWITGDPIMIYTPEL